MTRASAAIRAALRGYEPSGEQWLAITHPPQPLAIIAGAGSGKTAVMAARVVWMVEEGLYRPSQILGLTFTNKAASELEDRIHSAFAEFDASQVEYPPISTYNSFADRLVREYGVRIGIDPDVGLLSKAQSWQLLMKELENLPPFEAVESRSMSTVIGTAIGLADQCANHLVAPERIQEEDRRILEEPDLFDSDIVRASGQRIEYAGVVRAYLNAKRRSRRIDFGDQVTQAVEVLERFPEVGAELRERYPALLLDEYQDTNVAQRKLLQHLAPTGHNVTAVGDARQNIFQWRGSTLFNLIDFPIRHFLREGDTGHDYLPLSTNYRSGKVILDVANHIIEQVPAERRPGTPLVAHPSNFDAGVSLRVLSDQYAEAEFIAEQISELHGTRTHSEREETRWSDFAILVRRKAHIPAIFQALKDRDIPVEVVGLGGLLQVPEVMDTIAWLRLLADPGPYGNRWLARILIGPRFRIDYRDLALLARWAAAHTLELAEAKRGGATSSGQAPIISDETEFEPDEVAFSLWEAVEHIDEIAGLGQAAKRRLAQARDEIAALRPKAGGPLLELVQTVISETGLAEALDSSIREDAAASRRNLTSFLAVVAGFEPVDGEASLGAFLSYLDAAEDVEETLELAADVAGDSVKLMTIHQAKGLEFEVVFVPAVAAQTNDEDKYVHSIFPDTRASNPMSSYGQLPFSVREDAIHLPNPWTTDANGARIAKKKNEFKEELTDRAIEDERRLFYVALTRAKQRLFISCAWWYERQSQVRGPSQFFDEVKPITGVEFLGEDPKATQNPLNDLMALRSQWPPDPPHHISPSNLFPEGYARSLEDLLSNKTTPDQLIAHLNPGEADHAGSLIESHRATVEALRAAKRERETQIGDRVIGSMSATSAVGITSGSLNIARLLRPMPERPSAAARIGTEIHRWIEEQARGLSGLADEEVLELPAAHVDRSHLESLRGAWREMGYEGRTLGRLETGEPMAEMPFVLKVGNRLIRGRIDAVYEDDGGLEIVDFKTGAEFDPPELDQLLVYAAALRQIGVALRGPLRLTYAHLATQVKKSRVIDGAEAEAALSQLGSALAASG